MFITGWSYSTRGIDLELGHDLHMSINDFPMSYKKNAENIEDT